MTAAALLDDRILLDRAIRFGPTTVPYRLALGAWDAFADELAELAPDRVLAVVDAGVPNQLVAPTLDACRQVAPTLVAPVPGTDTAKTLATLEQLARVAATGGCTRRSVVVAIGGGAVGNLAGLLAATLFRGIRLVHVPTTLLAATDSVLSFKQAVNLDGGKNLIGTYLAPSLVWCDADTLHTLPNVQMRSGLFEVLKNLLVVDDRRLAWFLDLLDRGGPTITDLVHVTDLCIAAKSTLMIDDPHERRAAVALEYGHTVGHAIEKATRMRVPHGHAVGVGMLVAAHVAHRLGLLADEHVGLHHDVIARVDPVFALPDVPTGDVLRAVRLDNKRGYRDTGGPDEIAMVLLHRPGRPVTGHDGLPLVPVPVDVVGACLDRVRDLNRKVHR